MLDNHNMERQVQILSSQQENIHPEQNNSFL